MGRGALTNSSRKPKQFCPGLFCLAVILACSATHAGDEDMSPNAYHIFDPETGYMMTVESAPEGQDGTTRADQGASTEPAHGQTANADEFVFWPYLVVAVLIAGLLIAWKRTRDRIAGAES